MSYTTILFGTGHWPLIDADTPEEIISLIAFGLLYIAALLFVAITLYRHNKGKADANKIILNDTRRQIADNIFISDSEDKNNYYYVVETDTSVLFITLNKRDEDKCVDIQQTIISLSSSEFKSDRYYFILDTLLKQQFVKYKIIQETTGEDLVNIKDEEIHWVKEFLLNHQTANDHSV